MRQWLEYVAVWLLLKSLGFLPRSLARAAGAIIGVFAYHALRRLRNVGRSNLQLALPQIPTTEREVILRRLYRNLGWLLAEFCQMPHYTAAKMSAIARYEGLDHYVLARDRGRGVLIITGHLGAWELSSYYHSMMGYPMNMVIRRLDNPRVDALVNSIRCLHGNKVLHKDDFARGLLGAMRNGETVGILMDTNMTPPQGVFVDFFGHEACTASGLARIALKTNAAVLPGFLLWEEAEQKYVLHFGEEIELVRSADNEDDIRLNTALFTRVIESYIRSYPDQWLWVHRRWKTRPEGAASILGGGLKAE